VKLLLDENISHRLLKVLDAVYSGSEHVNTIRPELRSDRMIWEHARSNRFVILTFDTDFVQLSALLGKPPKVLLLTLRNPRHSRIAELLDVQQAGIEAFAADMAPDAPGVMEIKEPLG
jgi:predicted nuclease of predicted toxin-antitoxin system